MNIFSWNRDMRHNDLILVSMPWASTTQPSIALGILSAIAREEGVQSSVLYLNMDMSALVGFEPARKLASDRSLHGVSEHLFACDMFGSSGLSSDEFIAALTELMVEPPFDSVEYIKDIRDRVIPLFLDKAEDRITGERPSVVGFSATFNQVLSGLALARRIKRSMPGVQVIFGGACFDGEMGIEYHRALPEIIDHIFVGEADDSFREYCVNISRGESARGIPGVTWYAESRVRFIPRNPPPDLGRIPVPDYDDFFREKARMERESGLVFNIDSLPFESSRGCWWGEKSHCMFCGLNEQTISFREKPVDRVIAEILYLSARYRIAHLNASDWIMSRRSRGALFDGLSKLDFDIDLFYETRADMSKEEIAAMWRAGIRRVQPGIESLSSPLLRLMRKGSTRIRHVQFMRWCREYGISIHYNLLCGFPGEKAEWYHEMAEFLKRIVHLQPPLYNLNPVEMHRFSPLFNGRERPGFGEWRVREDYGFNFPPGLIDPDKTGYFFTFKGQTVARESEYAEGVRAAVTHWKESHSLKSPPVYHYIIGPGFIRINDTREGEGRQFFLSDLHQDVLLLCDSIQSQATLERLLQKRYPEQTRNGGVEAVTEKLLSEDLLMREDDLYLTLPIGYRPRTTDELRRYATGDSSGERAGETALRAEGVTA